MSLHPTSIMGAAMPTRTIMDWFILFWDMGDRLFGVIDGPEFLPGRWHLTPPLRLLDIDGGTAETFSGSRYVLKQPMNIFALESSHVMLEFGSVVSWEEGAADRAGRTPPDEEGIVPDDVWAAISEAAEALRVELPESTPDAARDFLRIHGLAAAPGKRRSRKKAKGRSQ